MITEWVLAPSLRGRWHYVESQAASGARKTLCGRVIVPTDGSLRTDDPTESEQCEKCRDVLLSDGR